MPTSSPPLSDAAVLALVRARLTEAADPQALASSSRFFKEEIRPYGVRAATVRLLAKQVLAQAGDRDIDRVFGLSEELWRSGRLEETSVACYWAAALHRQFRAADVAVFEHWVDAYVDNWASCDALCTDAIGRYLLRFEGSVDRVAGWATSPNRWMRRAAAVSFVLPARRGHHLDTVFTVADALIEDTDDLVRKGYGWLLKSASQVHPDAVFDYLMARRDVMPRTAFRYALEKLPPPMRDEAMGRTARA